MASTNAQERIRAHEEAVRASFAKQGLKSVLVVHFPKKKKPPLTGQLGVWLVNRAGGIIATKYMAENGTITNKGSKKSR